MIDATQIWERLFLGSLLDAERLGRTNPHGITSVISLSESSPCNTRCGIHYIHVPIDDAQALSLDQFTAIMRAISDNIRRGKLLIHCGSGISRAPIMTAAYMCVVGHKDLDTALVEIAGLRPIIAPSAILVASVKAHLR